MNKAYARVIWVNYPATDTPINETNLNRMDLALDTIDDRVIILDTTKANESDLLTCVASISFNPTTGIMTITQKNGTVRTIDTGLSKLAINFDYDEDPTSPHYQQIIMEMKDGTYKYIDLSALLTQYEFTNSSTIAWTIGNDGTVSASVVNGSITADKLQPNYLADIIVEVGKAQTAATNANADAILAKSYAVGGTGTRSGEDTDNAKYYKEQAAAIAGGNYVSYDPQPLTDSQKAQARDNIGALSYETQNLSDAQKLQSRSNITAASNIEMSTILNVLGAKNLLPNKLVSGTYGGATVSKHSNGRITINGTYTITTPGTREYILLSASHTDQDIEWLRALDGVRLSLSKGSVQNVGLVFSTKNSGGIPLQEWWCNLGSSDEATHTLHMSNVASYACALFIDETTTFDNVDIFPMLRPSAITDDTYVPYVKTNMDLMKSFKATTKGAGSWTLSELVYYAPYLEITRYFISVLTTDLPSDYPQKMIDLGATNPNTVMFEIDKTSGQVAHVTLTAMSSTYGLTTIRGYWQGNVFQWGMPDSNEFKRIQISATDITAGTTALDTNKLYLVYD